MTFKEWFKARIGPLAYLVHRMMNGEVETIGAVHRPVVAVALARRAYRPLQLTPIPNTPELP